MDAAGSTTALGASLTSSSLGGKYAGQDGG